jgi:hypothetical protein
MRAVVLLACAVVAATPAMAQTICGERRDFLKQLDSSYGEQTEALGIAANGAVLEVLTSDQGSWTILVTSPKGTTCVVATGENWETIHQIAKAPGA